MMIVLIDNYDSFTYNLYQYLSELDEDVRVVRNDQTTPALIEKMKPGQIVISPGPGEPSSAGICLDVIRELGGKIPILGVCLGHQAIGHVFGGSVVRADAAIHGKSSHVYHGGNGIFRDIPSPFPAARYHSLVVSQSELPPCLEVTARTLDGEIMAVRHRELEIHGVQFHPESILTQYGKQLLSNFLSMAQGLSPSITWS